MSRMLVLYFLALGLASCGGNREPDFRFLNDPSDIEIASSNLLIDGKSKRPVFVLDSFRGGVGVFAAQDRNFLEMIRSDYSDAAPIPVGKNAVAMATSEVSNEEALLYVLDSNPAALQVIRVESTSKDKAEPLSFQWLDVSGADRINWIEPVFIDSRPSSRPVFKTLEIDALENDCESFELKYKGSEQRFALRRSSDEDAQSLLEENQLESLASGNVRIQVDSGSRQISSGDRFVWFACQANVLPLTLGTAVDIAYHDDKVYILAQSPNELLILNASDLSEFARLDLSALTKPGNLKKLGDQLYALDLGSPAVFQYDVELQSSSVLTLPSIATDLFSGNSAKELWFVDPQGALNLVDTGDVSAVLTSLEIPDRANRGQFFVRDGKNLGLVSTLGGSLELINLESQERIDTRDRDGKDASVSSPEFVDFGAESDPEMISVNIEEGARSENWTLTYEGRVPSLVELAASLTGNQVLLDAPVPNLASLVQAGDLLEITVDEAVLEQQTLSSIGGDNQTLVLDEAPTRQGNQIVSVRLQNAYTAYGSLSAYQSNRVLENEVYRSDNEKLALFIRASLSKPTTEGDLFVFSASDGITPIYLGSRDSSAGLVGASVIWDKNGSEKQAFVLYPGSQSVAAIDLIEETLLDLVR